MTASPSSSTRNCVVVPSVEGPGGPLSEASTPPFSSKGKGVIPKKIRAALGLKVGAQFVGGADRDFVIFKVLDPASLRGFSSLVGAFWQAAKRAGLRPADIDK